jgi:hypothetical protein
MRRMSTGRLALSLPVVWVENGGTPLAGRLDVSESGLRLDGGSREARRTLDVPFAELVSFRVGRDNGDRIGGRRCLVLELAGGSVVSIAAFDRPGAEAELLELLELAA